MYSLALTGQFPDHMFYIDRHTNSHAHTATRADPKPLKEACSHIPAIAIRSRSPDCRSQRDHRADDKHDPSSIYIAQSRPEERANRQAEGRDRDRPVHLAVADTELGLELRKGGDGCCC